MTTDPIETIRDGPRGAEFVRLDLHIHTYGASHDVKDSAMTPEAVVEAAEREGLDVVSVTDHNDIGNVSAALAAGADSDVFVVPGVELSTPEGHLLAYCPGLNELEKFYAKLSIEGRGTPDSRCQTGMLDCLRFADEFGGLCILAHVDAPKGLETVNPGASLHKKDIIAHEALLGIELASAASRISYTSEDEDDVRKEVGRARRGRLGEAKGRLARVLFSDSHSLSALGRNAHKETRLTRAKMELTFHGLRLALLSPDARIRLEDEIPGSVTRMLGVHFDGGFLDGSVLRFSKNLTCIIGGRGAGKSAALEAVRCLGTHGTSNDIVDSDAWPEVLHAAWEDEVGQTHGVRRELERDPERAGQSDDGPCRCPMECVGQGETAEASSNAASDPESLLHFLDQFVDVSEAEEEEQHRRDELVDSQSAIEEAQGHVSKIASAKARLTKTTTQLKALEAAKAKEIVQLERKIATERTTREELERQAKELPVETSLEGATDLLAEMKEALEGVSLQAVSEYVETISKNVDVAATHLANVETKATEYASDFAAQVAASLKEWKSKEEELTEKIATRRKELEKEGAQLNLQYIKTLATSEARLKNRLRTLGRWPSKLTALLKKRRKLLGARWSARGTIGTARTAFAVSVSGRLRGVLKEMHVSLKYRESSFSPEAVDIVKEAMRWRTSQVPRARLLVEELSVPGLLDAMATRNSSAIEDVRSADDELVFSHNDAVEVLARLSEDSTRWRLESCAVRDLPRLSVTLETKGGDGARTVTRDFSKLSLGQQQSVLLTVMLSSENRHPLVIDQPEDNLDGEFVFRSLVPALRRAKERRQVIVVTHNANIAVLGDAEQIIVLESAHNRGGVATQGSIDIEATRKIACKVLEGAEEAFRRRAEIYALD